MKLEVYEDESRHKNILKNLSNKKQLLMLIKFLMTNLFLRSLVTKKNKPMNLKELKQMIKEEFEAFTEADDVSVDVDAEEMAADKNPEDTTLIITIDDETQIMTVKEVDERVMSSIEKLSEILRENKITFNRKMILFRNE